MSVTELGNESSSSEEQRLSRESGSPAVSLSPERVLFMSILLGAFARLYRLGSQSIWGDESLTLFKYAAGRNFAELWANIWHYATHPPLYFIIVHYWYLIGQSEFMLRFPSAVFGIASIPVMYALANRVFGKTTAAISALVLALSPLNIWYSQEARMYSLQILLCLAATLYFVKLWQDRRPKDAVLYIVLLLAALFTHLATLALVATHGIFALLASTRNWKRFAAWALVQIIIICLFAPWLVNMVEARNDWDGTVKIGFVRPSSIMDTAYGFYSLSVGYSVGPSVADLHSATGMKSLKRHLGVIALTGIVFGLLALLGMLHARRSNPWGMWFLLAMMLVPAGLAGLASLIPGIPMNPRYMMVSIIPYSILLALGTQEAFRRRILVVIPALAFVLTVLAIYNNYFKSEYWKQDVRSAVAEIKADQKPGDVIIISSIELGGPFVYYYGRKGLPYYGYPSRPGVVDEGRIPTDLVSLTTGKRRVWLLLGRTWSSDPKGLIPDYFSRRGAPVTSHTYPGVRLLCYDLDAPPR